MKRSAYGWMIAGAAMGFLSAQVGMNMMQNGKIKKSMRRQAARMTSKVSRQAGSMITDMGQSLARKMY